MTFSGGGRVVKNAAGYNMCRLMAGSWGTLGVITQATLMVRPLPEASALLACEVRDFDLAEKLLAGLVRSPVRPVAVELAAGRSHEGNPLFGPLLEGNACRLYVGFEGSAAEVEWMLGTLHQEWAALGMTSPVLMPSLATDKLWRWISEFPADVQINVLPSKLIETIVEVLKAAPDCADPRPRRRRRDPCHVCTDEGWALQCPVRTARTRGRAAPGTPRDAGDQGPLRPQEHPQSGALSYSTATHTDCAGRLADASQQVAELNDHDHDGFDNRTPPAAEPRRRDRLRSVPALRSLRAVYVELPDVHRGGRRERRPPRPHPVDADGGRRAQRA